MIGIGKPRARSRRLKTRVVEREPRNFLSWNTFWMIFSPTNFDPSHPLAGL